MKAIWSMALISFIATRGRRLLAGAQRAAGAIRASNARTNVRAGNLLRDEKRQTQGIPHALRGKRRWRNRHCAEDRIDMLIGG
jgi:hypothetical protein